MFHQGCPKWVVSKKEGNSNMQEQPWVRHYMHERVGVLLLQTEALVRTLPLLWNLQSKPQICTGWPWPWPREPFFTRRSSQFRFARWSELKVVNVVHQHALKLNRLGLGLGGRRIFRSNLRFERWIPEIWSREFDIRWPLLDSINVVAWSDHLFVFQSIPLNAIKFSGRQAHPVISSCKVWTSALRWIGSFRMWSVSGLYPN